MKILVPIFAVMYTFLYTPIIKSDTDYLLRRLFTTPLERNRIDEMRNNKNNAYEGESTKQPGIVTGKIELNGFVIRENGDSVVWVNGHNNMTGGLISEVLRVYPHGYKNHQYIELQANGKLLKMRPGQVWNRASGRINEAYLTKKSNSASGVVAKQDLR